MDPITDPIVDQVIAKYKQRSEVGIKKYGTTLASNKLSLTEWITHVQEELMDATLYLEKLKEELPDRFKNTKDSQVVNHALSTASCESEPWTHTWNHEDEFQSGTSSSQPKSYPVVR